MRLACRRGEISRVTAVLAEGTAFEGGEDAKRVKAVAPVGDFAVIDGGHGDVSVAAGVTGGGDPALGGVLEDDSRR